VAESKSDLLNQLTVTQLKELAEDNDVELEGSTKSDIVDELSSSRKVTKDTVQSKLDESGSGIDPAVAATSGGLPTNAGNTGNAAPQASEANDASPTGGANTAGTPVSQLANTQMVDASGSNIPAPNLRQPAAEGQVEAHGDSNVTPQSLDPMLTDPVGTVKERVQGRTSDANQRQAGVVAADVPPDVSSDVKPSDGGPVLYPFPPAGDVDVATVPDGAQAGEYFPNLEVEDWVVLDGSHELVPDRLDGRRAIVLDAPRYLVPLNRKDDVWISVRTRDDANATLSIPLAAVKEIQKGGLAPAVRG
jgi:hypothetical protein